MFFLICVIGLTCRSQALGGPDIWKDDINDLPWLGQFPANAAPPTVAGPIPMTENEGVIHQRPGHSVIIWPGANGDPPRVEQRRGIVTQSTLQL
jgi:hypothetical protein